MSTSSYEKSEHKANNKANKKTLIKIKQQAPAPIQVQPELPIKSGLRHEKKLSDYLLTQGIDNALTPANNKVYDMLIENDIERHLIQIKTMHDNGEKNNPKGDNTYIREKDERKLIEAARKNNMRPIVIYNIVGRPEEYLAECLDYRGFYFKYIHIAGKNCFTNL
jgi:hypothetical protein